MAAFERLFCGGSSAHYSLMSSLKNDELEYVKQKLEAAQQVQALHSSNCDLRKGILTEKHKMEVQVAKKIEQIILNGMMSDKPMKQVKAEVKSYMNKVAIECPTFFADFKNNSIQYKKLLALQ